MAGGVGARSDGFNAAKVMMRKSVQGKRWPRQAGAASATRVIALYEQVKQCVLSKVADGTLVDGARVPSEHELAKALGMSRVTVHRALHDLAKQGLVSRVQGSGTFIKVPPARSSLIEICNIAEEVISRGHQHSARLLSLESVDSDRQLARFLQVRPGSKVLHSVVIHFEENAPVQLEERFVNPKFAPKYLQQDFTNKPTSEYLHSISYVAEAGHTVFAIQPDARTSKILEVKATDPCLRLVGETWVGRLPTSKNALTYAGKRYSLSNRYLVGGK